MKIRAMTTSLVLVLAGYAAGASALEPSAVLRQSQGRVFVGQSKAMEPARDGLALYAGNRVVTVAGGQAEVMYPDDCVVALPENSLLVVGGPEQCHQGLAHVRTINGFQDTRIGQAPPSDDDDDNRIGLYIFGGALGLAAVTAIAQGNNKEDAGPASPQ